MKTILVALALALGAGTAMAEEEESPKVRKARLESAVEKEVAAVNAKCGTKLTASIDWSGFDADTAGWAGKSVSGYCEGPMNALQHFCEGANAKAYIQKNLEVITCHAAKDKNGWKLTVEKGHLHWYVSPDSSNNDEYARAQVLKNL